MQNEEVPSGPSRRAVLSLAATGIALPLLLAACSPAAGGGSSPALKFWDMPWGGTDYLAAEKALVRSYRAAKGLPGVSYQLVPWANFSETFSSAVASKTGPAVSSGGGFQAFQFAEQGAIAYADKVVAAMKKNGMYDDFIPGLLDSFKTDKGYVAIPWSIDMRVIWYRKSLLEKAGVDVPTDWDSLRAAGLALKKIGAYGFGTGAGAGNANGNQSVLAMILNNGGGLFDADGELDALTDANIEAVDFVIGLAKDGIVDPASVSYTSDNMLSQWKAQKFGIGVYNPNLINDTDSTDGDLLVTSPLTSASGEKGTIVYIPNLMMYTNTPSQEGSEAFLLWYLEHIKTYWSQGVTSLLPAFTSITETPAFQKNTEGVKIVKEWAPLAKTLAAHSPSQFAGLAALDGGSAINQFAQAVLAGQTTAKQALQNLQKSLQDVVAR